ncbi:MAG: single-stranded DNA-binding protein [Rikenellaceae bacterium]
MINRVILRGFVADEPFIHALPNGMMARVRVATIERVLVKTSGGMREIIEWHTVFAHGELAHTIDQQVKIGTPIEVEGKLRNRKWSDRKGVQHDTAEVAADKLTVLQEIVGYTLPSQIVERMPVVKSNTTKRDKTEPIKAPLSDPDNLPF